MPRAALISGACLLLFGCATANPDPVPAGVTRSPMEVMADSTKRLVMYAAEASDTALMRTEFAIRERQLDKAMALMASARTSAASAQRHADAAITHGDWIRNAVATDERARAFGYHRYWLLGRAKLDSARTHSGHAMSMADSALACDGAECAALRAQLLRTYIIAAAGAAREAESLVRVALTYAR